MAATGPGADSSGRLRRLVLARGAEGLGDGDLLALVLGGSRAGPVADRLLARTGGCTGLKGLHPAVMRRIEGMGEVRTARLLAAVELGARSLAYREPGSLTVRRPEDLHPLLWRRFRGLDRERFLALYLDTRHRVLAVETVSIGTLNVSVVHPREVFKLAVALSAAAVIVAHNHPSGCAEPSPEDMELTARLDRCGQLLGISLLDHLVAGGQEIVSIRETGWPTGPAG